MVVPKHTRPGERRNPSNYIIAGGSVFIAVVLIAAWVYSAPAAIPDQPRETTTSADTKAPVKSADDNIPSDVPSEMSADVSTTINEETVKDPPVEAVANNEDLTPVDSGSKESTIDEGAENLKTDDGKKGGGISSQAELMTENKESNETNIETQVQEVKEQPSSDVATQTEEITPAEPAPTLEEVVENNNTKVVIEEWTLCRMRDAQDFIPCLDNVKAIKKLRSRKHYQHRERHCPSENDLPKCLVPLPKDYKTPIGWPKSRDQIWLSNVPHIQLVSYKADQNWVKVSANKEMLIFPGGGTQFKNGATHYINFIQETVPDIAWGKKTRVLLDVGCGVASFGGYMFDKDVLTMSVAPKDEHEAQVQMALERGIPALSAVMGTQRLIFPSNVFDVVHCARCRVPWHVDGGMLLLELNRVLRPGGYFVWSATPVYWKDEKSQQIWRDTLAVTQRMSWNLVMKKSDPESRVGIAVFQKPKDNNLYDLRKEDAAPFCKPDDKPDAAWYVPMKPCMHKIPDAKGARATRWPAEWPLRVESTPYWLSDTEMGIFGKPLAEEFKLDTEHWKRVIDNSYMEGVGIDWSTVRNVMDMKANYGGFATALITQPVWVMNVIPITEPDTLPIIFDRGLIGTYHDWCEPHSTYPRSYDLMHADHLLSTLTTRCNILYVVMEMDRILRPEGWAIFRDTTKMLQEVEDIVKSLHWDTKFMFTQGSEELLVAQKKFWRPVLS